MNHTGEFSADGSTIEMNVLLPAISTVSVCASVDKENDASFYFFEKMKKGGKKEKIDSGLLDGLLVLRPWCAAQSTHTHRPLIDCRMWLGGDGRWWRKTDTTAAESLSSVELPLVIVPPFRYSVSQFEKKWVEMTQICGWLATISSLHSPSTSQFDCEEHRKCPSWRIH